MYLTQVRGGEGGIRTPDTVARMPHFECGAFNHSATSPGACGSCRDPSGGGVLSQAARPKQGPSPGVLPFSNACRTRPAGRGLLGCALRGGVATFLDSPISLFR